MEGRIPKNPGKNSPSSWDENQQETQTNWTRVTEVGGERLSAAPFNCFMLAGFTCAPSESLFNHFRLGDLKRTSLFNLHSESTSNYGNAKYGKRFKQLFCILFLTSHFQNYSIITMFGNGSHLEKTSLWLGKPRSKRRSRFLWWLIFPYWSSLCGW